ncbi:BTAD domain-containing putative transcriptional regulator [Jatrophihabitans endophyticus]|uniref:BTAD domain-containing putative transcriptional regulator n=1 Tax=Jatrophihabitans endophyticus TaxID=1206085 RepID=UPI0019E49401|nr:BTAD domain-containing putative transcriptional regulator [Jatrophihabitans endophyticus]MBE7188607.1 hypothetical protein [Jatrophihabitans endophyticus]
MSAAVDAGGVEPDADDVDGWLEVARAAEVGLRLTVRTAALERVESLLATAGAESQPPGRHWAWEARAERAIDLARLERIPDALALANRVLAEAPPDAAIARARATEALGRARAWAGTDAGTSDARQVLTAAAELYRQLGRTEWQGYVIFFRGNVVHLQNGELAESARCMTEALAVLDPASPRRSFVLSFYADVLLALGRWSEAAEALDEGTRLADAAADTTARAYMTWTRARLASVRGDAMATERLIRETERDAADWFDIHTGSTFLADAAEMLDRVGQRDAALRYLDRALERGQGDSFVPMARAAVLARSGDPLEALDALQELARTDWLEKRFLWRLQMFTAFATLRAGGSGVGEAVARGLELAVGNGGVEVATRGEPDLTAALLPLAEAAGSDIARAELLGAEREYVIRLFGAVVVSRRDGSRVVLPAGQPSELVRMLAVTPSGLPVELVLDAFFPDVDLTRSRQRLRQILTRLRAAAGDLVRRTDDHLVLAPAWVDIRAFREIADRARAARGPRAVQLAHAALALWTGPPLPTDPYTSWASSHRRLLTHRHLTLLDLVAADAGARDSHDEALVALTAAIEADPDDTSRYHLAAGHLRALGRTGAARQLLDGVEDDL